MFWLKNNQPQQLIKDVLPRMLTLKSSNASQLFLQNVNAADIGLYLTTVTGTCGADTSDMIYVYVKKEANTTETEVFLWPTIVREEFNVAISNDAFYDIQIFNTNGQIFRRQTKRQYKNTVNISDLPRGVYIIMVFNKSFRKSIKLIKE